MTSPETSPDAAQRQALCDRLHLPYISCGDGWLDLLEGGVEALERLGVQIWDVKEKFGGLRVAIVGPHDVEADHIVYNLEIRSYETCEACGAPGLLRPSRAWVRTLCDCCHESTLLR